MASEAVVLSFSPVLLAAPAVVMTHIGGVRVEDQSIVTQDSRQEPTQLPTNNARHRPVDVLSTVRPGFTSGSSGQDGGEEI